MNRFIALASLTLALVAAPVFAQTAASVPVKDLDVFVDLPTGFTFVKMPAGWKFVGKLGADQIRRLPASTLTSLLPPEEVEIRTAHPATRPAPRLKQDDVQG
jgi:hypothetical protein